MTNDAFSRFIRSLRWGELLSYGALIVSTIVVFAVGYQMIARSVDDSTASRTAAESAQNQANAANTVLGYAVGLKRLDSRDAPTQYFLELRNALARSQELNASAPSDDDARVRDLRAQVDATFQDLQSAAQTLLTAVQPGAQTQAFDLPVNRVATTEAAFVGALRNLGSYYEERARQATTRARYQAAALGLILIALVALQIVLVIAPVHRAASRRLEHKVRSQEQHARIGAEVARHVAERDRREAEAQFRALFQEAAVGVALTDPFGLVIDTNRSLREILGYEAKELIGHLFGQWGDGENPIRWPDTVQAAASQNAQPREARYVRKDGRKVWVEETLSQVNAKDGRPIAWIGMVKDITVRKESEARLRYAATHDALTGLKNRDFFEEEVDTAFRRANIASSQIFSLLLIDLDRFKFINDGRGHKFGDEVLREVSRQIERWAGPDDVVARFGGDEFIVLLRGASQPDAVERAGVLLRILEGPLLVGGSLIGSSASAGVCAWAQAFRTPSDMIQAADAAVYRAKGAGRGRCAVFDAQMAAESSMRSRLADDLRFAVERQQLGLAYQPIFDMQRQVCVGFEALLRWSHPELGPIWPGFFVRVAEDAGLMRPIGNWVLEHASQQLADWRAQFSKADLAMNINLSAQQFTDPKLVSDLTSILRNADVPGSSVFLELTETLVLDRTRLATSAIEGLSRIGTRLVLDDFGTGYSSLAHLHRLPIHALKIDQSFVIGREGSMASPKIVSALIALSRSLGVDVVAEGVESAQQAALLSELGCRYGQGFFLSRPLDAERATSFLAGGALMEPTKSLVGRVGFEPT